MERHADVAGASGYLTDDLSHHALTIQAPLADDHRGRRPQAVGEAEDIEDVRRAGHKLCRRAGPESSGKTPGGAGHRHAAWIPGQLAGETMEPGRQALDRLGIGTLLRTIDLGTVLPRRLYVREDDDPGVAGAAALRDRL